MKYICRIFVYVLELLLYILFSNYNYAQSSGFNVDSFKATIQKLSSDSVKVNTIIENVTTLSCDDSVSKLILANEAKKISISQNWLPGIFKCNFALADIFFDCHKDYQQGFELLNQNVIIAENNGNIQNEAEAYETMAKKYAKLNQHDKAIEVLMKALLLKPGADLEIGILAVMGHDYSIINDYPNSITFYDSSLKLIESEVIRKKGSDKSDTTMRLGLKLNMAEIYLRIPDPEKALKNYEDVLRVSQYLKNKRFSTLSLTGLGRTYKLKRAYSKAISYFQNALVICRENSRFDDEATVLNELANTYMDSGIYPKARDYADSALSLAEGQHFQELLSKTNATYGNAYLKLNRTDLAVFYLHKALDIAKDSHSLSDQKEAWLGLKNAYVQNKHFDLALDAYQHYIATKDSATNIEKTNEAIRKDLEIKYKTDQAKKDAEYAKNIERVQLFTYGGYTGLAMVLALAFFMYRNYKTQKKYNALLSKEKKINLAHIEAQSNVLSDIAHIQSHEIRGPVSAILGFVQIFNFEDLSDPNNREIMEWIGVSADKLDTVVRNVVTKENVLRSEHKDDGKEVV